MTDTVSVVIPAFNAARYIGRAIESCLAQTRAPIEIVVVDDGSDDATAEIVSRFPFPVRLVRQQNGGPASARNRGLQECTGDWIGLLDADDYWFADKLQSQLAMAPAADVGVIYSLFDTYNGRAEPPEVGFAELWDYNWIGNSSAIVRRAALASVGGFHDNRALMSVEDYNLWLRLAAAKWRLILCPRILVHYERDVGISASHDRLMRASLYNIDHLEQVIPVGHARAEAKRLEIREDFARRALGARRMTAARQGFRELFMLRPSLRTALCLLATFMPSRLLDLRRALTRAYGAPAKPHTQSYPRLLPAAPGRRNRWTDCA